MRMPTALLALLTVAGCGGRTPKTAARVSPTPATTAYVATDDQWNDRGVARVEDLMNGRFPGVRLIQRDAGLEVQVRASTTFGGRTTPLFVVDGLAIETGADGLLMLSPSDIKKIVVLKDEVSLAQYGVRSGNGVVLITTKRP